MATYSKDSNGYTLSLTLTEKVNTTANTSDVTYKLVLKSNASNKYFEQYSIGYSVSLDGTVRASLARGKKYYAISANGSLTLCSGTATIRHNDDGTKTMPLAFSIDMASASYTPGAVSGSGSMKLTDIPRVSSVSATDAYIGGVSTITIAAASTSFTHTLRYKAAGQSAYTAIVQKTTLRSYNWTIPDALYSLLSATDKGIAVTIQCETYNGSTSVGTATTTLTASALDTVDVSGTVIDINPASVAYTGDETTLIRYVSTAKATMTASTNHGATLSKRTVNGKAIPTGQDYVTFDAAEKALYNFYAEDSRGFGASAGVMVTVVPYILPTISASVKRTAPTESTVTLSASGKVYTGSFGDGSNGVTVKERHRQAGGSWTAYTPITAAFDYDNNTWTAETTLYGLGYAYAYEVEVRIEDNFNAASTTPTVGRGIPVYDWGENDFRVNGQLIAAAGLQLCGGLTFGGSYTAEKLRTALGIGKLLWSGTLAAGESTTVPGSGNYRVFVLYCTGLGTAVLAARMNEGTDLIRGAGSTVVESGNLYTYGVTITASGESWTLTAAKNLTHTSGGSHTAANDLTLSKVYGMV